MMFSARLSPLDHLKVVFLSVVSYKFNNKLNNTMHFEQQKQPKKFPVFWWFNRQVLFSTTYESYLRYWCLASLLACRTCSEVLMTFCLNMARWFSQDNFCGNSDHTLQEDQNEIHMHQVVQTANWIYCRSTLSIIVSLVHFRKDNPISGPAALVSMKIL